MSGDAGALSIAVDLFKSSSDWVKTVMIVTPSLSLLGLLALVLYRPKREGAPAKQIGGECVRPEPMAREIEPRVRRVIDV